MKNTIEFPYDPDAGIVTIKGVAYHLNFFDTLRDVRDGKFELLMSAASPGNVGVNFRKMPIDTIQILENLIVEIHHD